MGYKSSKGFIKSWNGYKLHINTEVGDTPISTIFTYAALHDGQLALPLSKTTEQWIIHFYDSMDAAYESKIICDYST